MLWTLSLAHPNIYADTTRSVEVDLHRGRRGIFLSMLSWDHLQALFLHGAKGSCTCMVWVWRLGRWVSSHNYGTMTAFSGEVALFNR